MFLGRHAELAAVFTGILAEHLLDTSAMTQLFVREREEHEAVDGQVRAEFGAADREAAIDRRVVMTYGEMVGYLYHELQQPLATLQDD